MDGDDGDENILSPHLDWPKGVKKEEHKRGRGYRNF